MQQIIQPSYQLNLQRLAKLWLSVRHRGPQQTVTSSADEMEVRRKDQRQHSTMRAAVAELSQTVQDAESIWQNRQSLYVAVKHLLQSDGGVVDQEHFEAVLNDMLADHLDSLSLNLEKAKEVQSRFLPQTLPAVAGLDLFALLRPATELSGDFYDFLDITDDSFFFSVGDVSSKGMSAALLMPVLCKVLHTAVKFMPTPTPQALLRFVHDDLYAQLNGSAMFASMFVGHYHAPTRRLTYANAGHSPVIYKRNGAAAQLLKADGAPVGLLARGEWCDHTITLAPGDLLLIGTDGIVDVRNAMHHLFGYERLVTAVDQIGTSSAAEIADELLTELHRFAPNQLREDDQALVIFKGE